MKARIQLDRDTVLVDLSQPISLAIDLDFTAAQPRHFGAPAADSRAFSVPGFSGSVAHGASCNCNVVTLIPHCNGTHTECVGHLTTDPLDAHRVVPKGLLPALLVSIEPLAAQATHESTDPPPQAGDLLITRSAIEQKWQELPAFAPQALVIRTLPNEADKTRRDYSDRTPPYLTREAAGLFLARGIQHIIVDVPSIDRARDEGRLTAHRVFFGLPPQSRSLKDARRPGATITELAFVPNGVPDGSYLLEIQVPALGGDAVPSRPLLFRLEPP